MKHKTFKKILVAGLGFLSAVHYLVLVSKQIKYKLLKSHQVV